MSFGQVTGFPTWEDYIPEFKTQTLIMSIMSALAYQRENKITGAVFNEFNDIIELGTMIFFTAKGEYAIVSPECGGDRVRLSYADGTLVSQYYQFPIPGIDPTILKPNIKFDFDKDYKPGLPPVYGDNPPIYNEISPCPLPWQPGNPMPPPEDTITRCVPNPGQPFFNQSLLTQDITRNVFGYFAPPQPPCPDDPYVIAFHCIRNSKATSNNPLDTLQYFQFQTIIIRTKGIPPYIETPEGLVDRYNNPVNSNGDFIDRDGNPIPIMTYINEVDYFPTFPVFPEPIPPGVTGPTGPSEIPNRTFGYNLTFNSFVFSFRGSTFLPDFLEEVIPPEILIQDLQLANPDDLLARYRPWLVNKATAMYKSIAKDTNFDYFFTPFPEEQSIRILKNYAPYLGSITFTGHSYGGSLANILAQYLVERFPIYINAQTYAFAPVPYVRKCAPPLNPAGYIGFLLIRGFTNDNDCVPFLKVPNFSDQPEDYVQPLFPKELYDFYHIKTCSDGVILERINGYCFPNGGVPIYLSVNKDHSFLTYVDNIKKIDSEQFRDTVLSEQGITNFTISDEEVLRTLLASVPEFFGNAGRPNASIGVSFTEDPIRFLYRFAGFQEIDLNYKNLLESLRLKVDVNDCSDPDCNYTRCCDSSPISYKKQSRYNKNRNFQ